MGALILEYPAEGVWLLRIHRPERRNALDAALIGELRSALVAAAGDARCRVLLLAASGTVFCSGADLEEMAGGGTAAGDLANLLLELHTHRCPSIALVQGSALGGGVGLVAACDVALGTPSARFRLPEVRLGLLPAIVSAHLVRAMGARRALRHALDGEWFGPELALQEGLLHELVEGEQLVPRALQLAAAIGQGAAGALRRCKQVFAMSATRPLDAGLAADLAGEFTAAIVGAEARERLAARPTPGSPAAPPAGPRA